MVLQGNNLIPATGRWLILACGLLLSACTDLGPTTSPVPKARTEPAVVVRPTSVASAELSQYFRQVQSAQLTQGLLRTDGGAADTPYDADRLARNFEEIAFYSEYTDNFTQARTASTLRRWDKPVRLAVLFGDTVPQDQRIKDTANVREYAQRLSRATKHSVTVSEPANFYVVIAGEDDRAAALDQIVARNSAISAKSVANLVSLPRSTYCVVVGFQAGLEGKGYSSAIAVIRAENPGLLRQSCFHEEIAQGLGLLNDSPRARPSIFNDDDEFALLTSHDELMLSMLYDPRLKQGMTADEARPIARIIARDLMGQPL